MRRSGIAMMLAAASALAACGSTGSSSPASKPTTTSPPVASRKVILTSIVTTAAAHTAHVSVEVNMSGLGSNGSDGAFAVDADGVTDFASGDSQMTMKFNGPTRLTDTDFEVRVVDGVVYMKVPPGLDVSGTNGKPWVSVTPSAGSMNAASPFGLSGATDPTKALAYLEKVSDDVKAVGSEQIRGVDTTHYHATLDLAKAVDSNGQKLPAGLRDSMKGLAGLFGSMPADIWIDGEGRLRRMTLEIDLGQMFQGLATSGTTPADNLVITESIDLYDFGTPVHVEAPPVDEVTAMPAGAGG